MYGFDILFVIVLWWPTNLQGSGVNANEYFVNDILNPVNTEFDLWQQQRNARVAIRTNEQVECERPDIYFCEEQPNLIDVDVIKTCNFRNVRFHEQVYRWVAGRGCLLFTPDFLYAAGFNNLNLNTSCFYRNLRAPCLELPKEDGTCGCYPFDPGLEEVTAAVNQALIPSAHGRWERCFQAASDCCTNYMRASDYNSTEDECHATFDGWTCWHAAEAGTTVQEVCSEFAYSNVGPSCHHFSSKRCFANATWELQTDYSTCSITPRLLRRYYYHIAMLAFSIVLCLPAVIIFFYYKRLRIDRVALHRNLLIAIIMRNVLVIISRTTIYIDEITNTGDTTLSNHSVACRILSIAERIAGNAVFVCMLVEGIYLHRLIVAVFRKKLNVNWLYGIGAVIAIVPVIAWASVMGVHNDHSCWVIYTVDHVQWILDAPRITILLVNTVLFVDVLRVLLTKIRNAENANQLSTAKTTLFLMPIFGCQFLLTVFRPNTTNCTGEQAYFYVAYAVEGLQGVIVALLYCYINKEVRMLLKATYKKTESMVVSRVRRDSHYPRMSIDPKSDRRFTYSTAVPTHSVDDTKDHGRNITPKLHVAEIISIQASERLADILEPVYETIESGVINEGYDSLERSSVDNDSGFIANRGTKGDNYYNFTNVSSVSIDCQDWIKCVSSPTSSIYNNSLSDYESRDKKFPTHPNLKDFIEVKKRLSACDNIVEADPNKEKDCGDDKKASCSNERKSVDEFNETDEYDDDMLDEIMQYIETNDENSVKLNPDALSPNRKDDEKIVFLED
ncbi:unnamed protein product [Chilo suppressalis]|uniref:Uncharacterized protein n=1 Tax=Chilo suppressalis TaxID=168631 RepID=A0ABN8BBK0_CHISP|nr:unnamed protein product [Chilo suppressalis]